MQKFIGWLHKNRLANWLILSTYFLLVVLPHEIVGRFIMNSLLGHLSRPALNLTVLMFSLAALSVFLFVLTRNITQGEQKKIKLIYLFVTLGLIVLVYNTLFVLATESAHFPQYALMAILLFPLSRNYSATLFWATMLGALDEAYQYFYLNPISTGYFDFNDILTDLLGAALGLLFLWSFEIKGKMTDTPWFRKSIFLFGIGVLFLGGLLNILGFISSYPIEDGDNAAIILMRNVPHSFWSYDKVGDLYFHVVHPMEGIVLLSILLGMYSFLGVYKNQIQD